MTWNSVSITTTVILNEIQLRTATDTIRHACGSIETYFCRLQARQVLCGICQEFIAILIRGTVVVSLAIFCRDLRVSGPQNPVFLQGNGTIVG